MLIKSTIIENLEELSSVEIQKRRWLGDGTEPSSLDEAIAELFDNSGFNDLAEKGEVFGKDIDDRFLQLKSEYNKIQDIGDPNEVIDHPSMQKIRSLASQLLVMIKSRN